MKPYTIHIDIDLPRDRVLELFDNADNLFEWQNGLQSFEHLTGEPGQNGATSRLVYKMGNSSFELIETITNRNLPDQFDGHYSWGGGENTLKNRFIELGQNRTRWESTCEYKFNKLLLKLMGFFIPGSFVKQNMKFLENFKAFCEEGKSVQGQD